MIYAVLFEDDESHADKRPEFLSQHLAFLANHADEITAAGPLRDTNNGDPAGGLWLVEVDDVDIVRALIHEDPFWSTGLRKSFQILQWTRVFAAGERLV